MTEMTERFHLHIRKQQYQYELNILNLIVCRLGARIYVANATTTMVQKQRDAVSANKP
jgi:hypothetical protein